MTVKVYEIGRGHECDLPSPGSCAQGDLARCDECGRWWMRSWHDFEVRPIWTRCSRFHAWTLRRRFGVEASR